MKFKKTFFYIKQTIRPGVTNRYRELVRDQYLSEDELASINWAKRIKLLNHAFAFVPYYSSTFREAGLHPQDIKTEEDWSRLPILTKEQIRNNFDSLVATNVSENCLRMVTTGGSTGQPLKIYHDKRFPLETIGWRMLGWWGVQPSDDAAYCWRLIRKTWIRKAFNTLMWWPTKRIWFDASMMTDASAKRFIEKFNSLEPEFFQGYTGSIDYLAQYILRNNVEVYPPKCVWGTSSPISATQRSNIERAFRAPLYDQYGCSEVYWLAGQCRVKNGLHFFSDVRHIEFVDDNGMVLPLNETGNVVITDLKNYGFPLIRYQNGDVGRFLSEKCSCGINLPLIAPIKGRTSDLVRIPNGGAVGGDYITTLFDDFVDDVRSFQLRQAADYSIVLFVVPSRDLSATKIAVEKVIQSLASRTGGNLEIRYELVDEIRSNRGKTQFVISEVN